MLCSRGHAALLVLMLVLLSVPACCRCSCCCVVVLLSCCCLVGDVGVGGVGAVAVLLCWHNVVILCCRCAVVMSWCGVAVARWLWLSCVVMLSGGAVALCVGTVMQICCVCLLLCWCDVAAVCCRTVFVLFVLRRCVGGPFGSCNAFWVCGDVVMLGCCYVVICFVAIGVWRYAAVVMLRRLGV